MTARMWNLCLLHTAFGFPFWGCYGIKGASTMRHFKAVLKALALLSFPPCCHMHQTCNTSHIHASHVYCTVSFLREETEKFLSLSAMRNPVTLKPKPTRSTWVGPWNPETEVGARITRVKAHSHQTCCQCTFLYWVLKLLLVA